MSNQNLGGFISATYDPFSGKATEVEYLIVGGGGSGGDGGGASCGSAGGGAGGFREGTKLPVTPGVVYTVTVGAGGPQGTNAADPHGANGASSSFSTITASGGGGGGGNYQSVSNYLYNRGWPGGSAGGNCYGSGYNLPTATGNIGGFTPAEGYDGNQHGGGSGTGGGGAGGVGFASPSGNGNGGQGKGSTISGTLRFYAGGGGGAGYAGDYEISPGGRGGGGDGFSNLGFSGAGGAIELAAYGQSGRANSGGGGGGNNGAAPGQRGAGGGSGIAILRFPATLSPPANTVNSVSSYAHGYQIYTWTQSGTITF